MTKSTKLHCVDCGSYLNEVTIEANYGRLMIVDQCPQCGGVWFDKWELYFTADESLKTLGAFDRGSFVHPVTVSKGAGQCPRCSKPLLAFVDPSLPPQGSIRRCDECSGVWLNVADIGRYEEHRKKFRTGLPQAFDREMRLQTLKKLQNTLDVSTLVGRPAPPDNSLQFAHGDSKKMVVDGGAMVLEALIRLLFNI